MNIPQSGAKWNIGNEQFVHEKVFGSPSFYTIGVTLDDTNSSKYILEVRLFVWVLFIFVFLNFYLIDFEGQ